MKYKRLILPLIVVGLGGILLGSFFFPPGKPGAEPPSRGGGSSGASPSGASTHSQSATQVDQKEKQGNSTKATTKNAGSTASCFAVQALQHARNLIKSDSYDNYVKATYFLTCALTHEPHNMEAVRQYHRVVKKIAELERKRGNLESALSRLEMLKEFLHRHTAYSSPGDIEELLRLANEIDGLIQKWSEQTPPSPGISLSEIEQKLQALEQFAERDSGVTSQGIQERIQEVLELEDALSLLEDSAVSSIKVRIARTRVRKVLENLRVQERFMALEKSFNELLNASDHRAKTPTAAAYYLQLCEGIVREMLALRNRLPDSWAVRVDGALEKLEKAAADLKKKRSQKIWQDFRSQKHNWKGYLFPRSFDDALKRIQQWTPPKEAKPDGSCQRQIETIQELIRALGEVATKVEDPDIAKEIHSYLKELSEKLRTVIELQRIRYSQWALQEIKTAYEEYKKATGTFGDDEKAIAAAMVDHLGHIDVNLLPYETSRILNEVFNTCFEELDLENDTQEVDSKLEVTTELARKRNEGEIKKLSDF